VQRSLHLDSCCRDAANLGQREVWPKKIVLVDIDGASGAEMPARNAAFRMTLTAGSRTVISTEFGAVTV
jgi:hypothetical protein